MTEELKGQILGLLAVTLWPLTVPEIRTHVGPGWTTRQIQNRLNQLIVEELVTKWPRRNDGPETYEYLLVGEKD